MKLQILAGAAVLALIATADASAATKKAGAYAEPAQPVAYAKLDAYLKAPPTKRAKQDWSLGSTATASVAPTGGAANTSATAPLAATPDTSAAPSAPVAAPAADSQTPAPAAPVQARSDQTSAPAAPATPPASDTPPAAPATPGT